MFFNTIQEAIYEAIMKTKMFHLSYTVYQKSVTGYDTYFTINQTSESIKNDFWCYCGTALLSTIITK